MHIGSDMFSMYMLLLVLLLRVMLACFCRGWYAVCLWVLWLTDYLYMLRFLQRGLLFYTNMVKHAIPPYSFNKACAAMRCKSRGLVNVTIYEWIYRWTAEGVCGGEVETQWRGKWGGSTLNIYIEMRVAKASGFEEPTATEEREREMNEKCNLCATESAITVSR